MVLASPAFAAGPRHVPSPDWRDQVVYFVVTDRFDDGDARNNDQRAREYDPRDGDRYSGGDLRGLARRLAYIQGLGATSVWITPPVANQWLDPSGAHAGYHGYWASHFKRVDPHLGTLADYRALASALHGRGMFLVQDIVLNHSGNFFEMTRDGRYRRFGAPAQQPFALNDPRRAADRRAAIYHWTPDVSDYGDRTQELSFQMSGLDDLNTENPAVRRALRDSYGHWIREVGVDAFRVDTAFYVPPELFADFLYARGSGMRDVARATGRRDFHVFGEGFGIDKPGDDAQARRIESYMSGAKGEPLLPGMLNFPLYGTLGDVFARGRPAAELGARIDSMMKVHPRVHLMPSFVDNHDVDRFLAGAGEAALKQSLLAIFTLPGIPVVYYGTEQGFTGQRASMFAAGFGSGGRDHFDAAHPLYRFIAQASALRRTHKLFSRGTPTVLAGHGAGPGAVAWRMAHQGQQAIVVFNTAEHETLLDNLDTGLAPGSRLEGLLGIDGMPPAQGVGADGRLTLRLPPRSGWVFRPAGAGAAPSPARALAIDALPSARVEGNFTLHGRAEGNVPLHVVIDGDIARAIEVTPAADGRWQAAIDTSRMDDPQAMHRALAWDASGGAVSNAVGFQVQRAWRVLADVDDPSGDERYAYPTDPGWGANRQMDLRRVTLSEAGGALRIDLAMNRVTRSWNPAHGFDHVAFSIFIELPGVPGGATAMPLQNAQLPDGMRWHLRLRAHGWSNALSSSEGASATSDGTPVTPAARIEVDAARHVVSFVIPSAALGARSSLSGAKVYVSTWDYDGGWRALAREPQAHAMSPGDPQRGAKVMDDTPVIVVP